jgi:aspartoacylase
VQEFIKKIVITGGTHGNELTGVYLVQNWSKQPQKYHRDSFKCQLLLANRKAIVAGRRYIDEDLNRCFSMAKLQSKKALTHEHKLAYEINDRLGGKGTQDAPDVIFDLHNTTSNMGVSLIFGQVTPYVKSLLHQLQSHSPLVRLYYMPEQQSNSSYLPTISPRDICVEIGPQPHGMLVSSLYFLAQDILTCALDFTEHYNSNTSQSTLPDGAAQLSVYRHVTNIDYPRNDRNEITAMIHPQLQGADYTGITADTPIFIDFLGNSIAFAQVAPTLAQTGKEYYPVFIGEQAYLEKGIAFSLTEACVL